MDVRAAADGHHRGIFTWAGDDFVVAGRAIVATFGGNDLVSGIFGARRGSLCACAAALSGRHSATAAIANASAQRDGCGVMEVRTYLFQIDCAANNDCFFEQRSQSARLFYRGRSFYVGEAKWVPDGIQVTDFDGGCTLTLIELEETRSTALTSARKYLPEESTQILDGFRKYVSRLIEDCRATGDAWRKEKLEELRKRLAEGTVSLYTAGALRAGQDFEEELPLIGQPDADVRRVELKQAAGEQNVLSAKPLNLAGTRKLNAETVKAVGRCIVIVDAIKQNKDHSNGTLHSWRTKAPLQKTVANRGENLPVLRKLLGEAIRSGTDLDYDELWKELAELWKETPEDCRRRIESSLPHCSAFRGGQRMNEIFDIVRKIGVPSDSLQ